jgi:Transposase
LKREQFCCKFKGRRLLLNCEYAVRNANFAAVLPLTGSVAISVLVKWPGCPTGVSIAISVPIAASILCMKPQAQLTRQEVVKVNWLKATLPSFVTARQLAMRFRSMLRGSDPSKLGGWLDDAHHMGLYGTQRFVLYLRCDIEAVRNAISERSSNGQTEGQINRHKTLKRSMYGRAGTELLRARMLPLTY